MSLEQKINYQLNKYPDIKKVIKRIYQRTMYLLSPKIKSSGKIIRISPNDQKHEYFFGYYDKSPWDITDRYILCMRADNTWSDVSPREKADILLIDTFLSERLLRHAPGTCSNPVCFNGWGRIFHHVFYIMIIGMENM